MKESKGLRILSIFLEATFLGSIILYIYNYIIANKKYEVIPAAVKSRLNVFVIIAIIAFILFLIVKYILYVGTRFSINDNSNEQLQMNFDNYYSKTQDVPAYKDLEAPVTERVFIYKNEYEVPKERIAHCKNCGSIVDKNAHICLKCGYLLKNIVQERIVERVITEPRREVVRPVVYKKAINKAKLTGILINLGLVIAILITIVLILNLAVERGIIG